MRQLTAVILCSVVLAAGIAGAEPVEESASARAQALDLKGEELLAQGRVDLAIAAFEKAYALDPTPQLLHTLGRAYRARGDLEIALAHFERYLDEEPDGPHADAARASILELRTLIAARRAGERRAKEERHKPSRAEEGASSRSTDRTLFFVSAGATVVLLGLTTYSAMRVKELEEQQADAAAEWSLSVDAPHGVSDACAAARERDYEPLVSICDEGEQTAFRANVFLVTSVVGLASTAFFFYRGYLRDEDSGRPAPSKGVTLTPFVGPVSGIDLRVSF